MSGATGSPDGMIRFVRAPDGAVAADLTGKAPGRGAWVSARPDFVARAAKNGFSRAFKAATRAPDDLAQTVGAGLRKRLLDTLGLARRGGLLAVGFDRVEKMLDKGGAAVLFVASDASADVAKKLLRRAPPGGIVGALTSAELSSAVGEENVHYAALSARPEAVARRRDVARFTAYLAAPTTGAPPQIRGR
ncbi:MAG: DUF448 domain-containing protein [Pseudomonadota bacterium]